MNFAEEYAVSKEKTKRFLKDSVRKDAKQLKTAIANLCNTCGYASERYLSPCTYCPYNELRIAIKSFLCKSNEERKKYD